jgi:hypothetical protein
VFGAILGDIIGAPYEFDRGGKTKDFPLFKEDSQFTDDSVMTAAVAEALMDTPGGTDDGIRAALIKSMQKWGRRYPDANYGARFSRWLWAEEPKPYPAHEARSNDDLAMIMEDAIALAESETDRVNTMKAEANIDGGELPDASEIADRFVRDPAEVVKTGDRITVRVLAVDKARGRISLSARTKPRDAARGGGGGASGTHGARPPSGPRRVGGEHGGRTFSSGFSCNPFANL